MMDKLPKRRAGDLDDDWIEARMFVFDRLGRSETKADEHDSRLRAVEGSIAGRKVSDAMRAALYGSLAASIITAILTQLGG